MTLIPGNRIKDE